MEKTDSAKELETKWKHDFLKYLSHQDKQTSDPQDGKMSFEENFHKLEIYLAARRDAQSETAVLKGEIELLQSELKKSRKDQIARIEKASQELFELTKINRELSLFKVKK